MRLEDMMHRNISVIMLIMASLFAKAQNFNTITRVVYEQQRISGYNSLNKLSAQVDCKDMVWQVLPDNSIKIWDDIHSFTVFSTTLTVPAFTALGDSLRAWQVSCGQSSTPFTINLDTTHIDTSLIVPTLIENFSNRNNDTLSAILLALNNLTPNDTSNFWIFDSIYQELKAVDTLCFTGEIAVSDSLLRTTVVDCGGTNAIAVKMCEGDTTNQFILKDIYKKIDTTNTILNNLYFVGCGESIPIGFIGYKFENAVDLSCSGGLPSTTEVCDFQHCLSSTPPSCIPMANQAAMQNFINSTLIPDLNACYGTSLVANDIIYIYNSALDEVEVWYNPALLTAANPPHNFVIAPIGTGASCEKPFPSIPIATSALSGGDALLVKVCEPLNVVTDTTINATIREMRDSIARQNIILLNQSTPTIMAATPSYTSNRTLFTANTTPAAYSVGVPANTREITIQNITGADIQITTSQGTQILGTMNNITLSNPNNTTINHAVFTGNITISFFSSVLGDISGVAPRVIIDFKAY